MDNIKNAVELFLKKVSAKDIIDGSLIFDRISERQFLDIALPYADEYSDNELVSIYATVRDVISLEYQKDFKYLFKESRKDSIDVFGLVLVIVGKLLLFNGSQVRCRYETLMDWRQVTVKVSEDVFTTAFCAASDLNFNHKRYSYDWPVVIGHNNFYLNKLMEQELSDNHFHLWASSPHFGLSWIHMMNDVDNAELTKNIKELNHNKLNTKQAYYQGYIEENFEKQHIQAALIRLYLYSWFSGKKIRLEEYYFEEDLRNTLDVKINGIFLAEYKEWLCKCRLPEHNIENQRELWKIIYKVFQEESKDVLSVRDKGNLREFLWRLKDYMEEQAIEAIENAENLWAWLSLVFRRLKKIPLKVLQTVVNEQFYNNEWNRNTKETVGRWLCEEQLLLFHVKSIQMTINSLKRDFNGNEQLDYVLCDLAESANLESRVHRILCGERYFLYRMFRKVYQYNQTDRTQVNWFYAYLVLKEGIRGEIIQSNERIGFRNFQKYDRRKSLFMNRPEFKDIVLSLALKDTLANPWLKNLEVRIVPRNTVEENIEYICDIEKNIQEESKKRFYFVYHFTKSADDTPQQEGTYSCRHEKKRSEIKNQACCIADMRKKYPVYARRVLGIDGCSQEIGCRPEVFAQVFRYLRNHVAVDYQKGTELPQLRVTYHVGEDFPDIVDGLRAIDEAVHFFNMDCGDRMGHALALGLNVEKYYNIKHKKVRLKKQDYLDNLAWLHNQIAKYCLGQQLTNLRDYIEKEFARYFSEVYGKLSEQHNYNIHTYIGAWQCRGDNPECYRRGWYEEPDFMGMSFDAYAINSIYPKDYEIRKNQAVSYLYYAYHYDEDVRKNGEIRKEFDIPQCWVEGVSIIQKQLQNEIAIRGIGIETNPSSNKMISILKTYDDHPIISWYNYHLVTDPESVAECPQLSVSINTDDKGCFSTSLENEFALMACALEMKKDKDGKHTYKRNMVYEWLDEVRKMGNLQSFQKDTKEE